VANNCSSRGFKSNAWQHSTSAGVNQASSFAGRFPCYAAGSFLSADNRGAAD